MASLCRQHCAGKRFIILTIVVVIIITYCHHFHLCAGITYCHHFPSLCRQKEDLEQVSVTMQEEKLRLQQEAEKLAQQLQAVLNDKFVRRNTFDAETPIDKTLGYLETVISVSSPCQ